MDPVFMHLRVNHFPVILPIVGAAAAFVALILKRDDVWKYAMVTVILGALSAPIAYWTGFRAEDKAEGFDYIDAERMDMHEETAEWALIAILASGVAAGVSLKVQKPAAKYAFLAVAAAAAVATTITAAHGGKIVHASPMLLPELADDGGSGGDHEKHDHR